jgi:drug/metabolite transporter (DMT)-like permease
VIAVVLALVAALFFGGMSVFVRIGLARSPDVGVGTLATVATAFLVAVAAVLAEAPSRGVHVGAAWPFLLAGLLQPGVGQFLVTLAIRETGASRASMIFGSAPLVSVAIALVFLGEPARAPLLAGAVLIVAGGVELARERGRPAHLRRIGMLFAFGAVLLFASRDNLVRWLAGSTALRRRSRPRRRSWAGSRARSRPWGRRCAGGTSGCSRSSPPASASGCPTWPRSRGTTGAG